MEFPLTSERLERCNPMSISLYTTMYSEILDAHIMVGDFVQVCLPAGNDVIGRLINISGLDDIPVTEIGTGNANYFFLDNGTEKICGLLHILKPIDTLIPGYERLSQTEQYRLRGINELVKSWTVMWFGSFSLENIAFLFNANELTSSANIAFYLNRNKNLYFARYSAQGGRYTRFLDPFCRFKSTHGYCYIIFSSLTHI